MNHSHKRIRSRNAIVALRQLAQNLREQDGAADYESVATELEEIAEEAEHFRAFATARFLVGPLSPLSADEALKVTQAVQQAPAAMEYTGHLPGGGTVTVRLVPFYDATLEEERWATEHHNTDGEFGLSDNALREDAEFRYWELAEPLGAVRT